MGSIRRLHRKFAAAVTSTVELFASLRVVSCKTMEFFSCMPGHYDGGALKQVEGGEVSCHRQVNATGSRAVLCVGSETIAWSQDVTLFNLNYMLIASKIVIPNGRQDMKSSTVSVRPWDSRILSVHGVGTIGGMHRGPTWACLLQRTPIGGQAS
ncbi:uncharacterized protein F5Z01DRAFT_662971 [Emericellopsis atlantica]|uniref:Uncharacterized protein n=1 Tax=Emericellopsis atlantica TaxID=2614577 RepID=A0A9P8CNA3_9HYPO|nr:uncharacterized protein F5Z01DRAFT_662971 [Emericellopsis atlantica]KAG9251506.1 hypothetical protein F5Z01DRAFT_662971 [Emericellopsis atlantica]